MKLQNFISANPYMADGWRRELIGGEPVELPPRDEAAAQRTLSLFPVLTGAIQRSKRALRVEMGGGVGVVRAAGDHFRIADFVIHAKRKTGKGDEPVLVVKQMSDAAAPDDEDKARLDVYRMVASVREVLVLSQDAPVVRLHRRFGDGWSETAAEGCDSAIRLETVGASLSLLSIYPEAGPSGADED